MTSIKHRIVECPICGYEYALGEIFIPKYAIGVPKKVIRDGNGKIVTINGQPIDTKEYYICDRCGTNILVSLDIRVNVTYEEDEYTTKLR